MIDELDKVLHYLYVNKPAGKTILEIRQSVFKNETVPIEELIKHLVREIMIELNVVLAIPYNGSSKDYYSISINGIISYESASIKDRPFKSMMRAKRINRIYTASKTIAIIINAAAILSIGYFTYRAEYKSAKLLEENNQYKHIADSLQNYIKTHRVH